MYMNHVGNSITISLDNQDEARALLAVLSGTPMNNPKAEVFGKGIYTFFYQAIYKLAADFAKETKGQYLYFPHSDQRSHPHKGHRGSL